jgi:hypothetical protein
MLSFRTCGLALLVIGCGKAADAAPAAITLDDVAGTWNVRSTLEGDTATVVEYQMVATGESSGWGIQFPGRADPVPVRVVAVDGDSIVSEAGPFESALRPGVQVSTRVVSRLRDGKLVGTTTAHYQVTTPDSVARLDFEGTRAP